MRELTVEELLNLKHSDRVYRWDGDSFRKLYFVGTMPGSPRSLIFCEGTYLTYLYIPTDGIMGSSWYAGDYNSEFVGNLKIQSLEEQLASTRKIYFNQNSKK